MGLGFAGPAQALSGFLPGHRVYHQPVPYYYFDLPEENWNAVVLNIPGAHAWSVADLLSQRRDTTFLQRRGILTGAKKGIGGNSAGHVVDLLDLVLRHRAAGRLLVVIGDPEPYHVVVRALVGTGFLSPAGIAGLNTAERGIWVDYAPGKTPWAPAPDSPGDRKVVSFWRWF